MKKILAVSNILSWVNLIIGSIIGLLVLWTAIATHVLAMLILVVLIGCIVLHSCAALQLRKSIINPLKPLSSETPVGIRLMGYVAMFLSILWFTTFITVLQNTQEVLKQIQFPKEMNNMDIKGMIRGMSIFMVLLSSSVILNVVLNLRLLRWYILARNSESK